jgi:5'-deoxy-5'-methylthioadenosine phosphorylase
MKYGIIGGSGLTRLKDLQVYHREVVKTPFGEASAPLIHGKFGDVDLVFLPRHGNGHRLPPDRINYRANIWALKHLGIEEVIGIATVGGITAPPDSLVIPDQLIDYTWGREQTFFDGVDGNVSHIDFTDPYCESLREKLIVAARDSGSTPLSGGVYGVTQGPRLETTAEIRRMKQDGCDLVGMTAMPEASLAREAGLCYATCALVVNWAAGIGDEGPISQELINRYLDKGMESIRRLILQLDS